jgi:uncharacterized protein YciI
MVMFLIELTYTQSIEMIDRARNDHLKFLDKYYKKGYFIFSGPKVPREGGFILAGNITKQELESILKEDTFNQQKLAEYKITEFNITMVSSDINSFFSK